MTGTNGKTTTAFLVARTAGGRRPPVRPARHGDVVRRRRRAADRPHDARGDRAAGDVLGDAAPEATPRAPWRSPRTRWRCTAPTRSTGRSPSSPTSPRTTSTSTPTWRTTSRPSGGSSPPPSERTVCVVNVDDPYGARLAQELTGAVTIGFTRGRGAARARRDQRRAGRGLRRWTVASCASPCPGASTSSTRWARSPPRAPWVSTTRPSPPPCHGLASVPGRFEPVDEGQGFPVLVDYAHTPDSLENVAARRARADAASACSCVVGAGGDRDRGKRPLMGAVAGAAGRHRGRDLRQPALRGSRGHRRRGAGGRRAATRRRSSTAARRSSTRSAWPRPATSCVIAGKGHEQGQELAGGAKIPFDDVTVAREAIRGRLGI